MNVSTPGLQALAEIVDLMVKRGVRRVRMPVQGFGEFEVELDPAAQVIHAAANEEPPDVPAEEKHAAGLCMARGCTEKGGVMNQPYCRKHFTAALSGRTS